MIRVTGKSGEYCAIKRWNANRYRINFDKVELDGELEGLAKWSAIDYFKTPKEEDVQADVKRYTIERYKNEGLEPPSEDDIDVSAYVITDVAVVDATSESLKKQNEALLEYINDKTGKDYSRLGEAVVDLVKNNNNN